jgi:hypothetical protein
METRENGARHPRAADLSVPTLDISDTRSLTNVL